MGAFILYASTTRACPIDFKFRNFKFAIRPSNYLIGTRCFSSSNQFSTSRTSGAAGPVAVSVWPGTASPRNLPSGIRSNGLRVCGGPVENGLGNATGFAKLGIGRGVTLTAFRDAGRGVDMHALVCV